MAGFGEWIAVQLFRTLAAAGALTTVSYKAIPEAVIDVTTGAVTQGATVRTYDMRLSSYDTREMDGVSIIAGDRRATLPVTSFVGIPTIRDQLSISDEQWEVIGVGKTANEGQWEWHIRRIGIP